MSTSAAASAVRLEPDIREPFNGTSQGYEPAQSLGRRHPGGTPGNPGGGRLPVTPGERRRAGHPRGGTRPAVRLARLARSGTYWFWFSPR
ncbi:hypothetical protein Kpho02_52790 [Kitasatospora phosalacinea]|uniref:Uncharacterized protein n=1 Tax=Kitasatospora phosalacinea TaxID=2065 RepID=A0A9W6V5C2_9ACTN|nr:hypothetical protein Kpho02_52790 [Kitasatospora phosalacinea]